MANTMTLVDIYPGVKTTTYVYKITLSGSYVQAVRGTNTGERLQPLLATDSSGTGFRAFPGNKGFTRGYPMQGPAGNGAEILPGADANNWLLKLYSAANTEVLAAAYNAAVTGDLDFYIALDAPSVG